MERESRKSTKIIDARSMWGAVREKEALLCLSGKEKRALELRAACLSLARVTNKVIRDTSVTSDVLREADLALEFNQNSLALKEHGIICEIKNKRIDDVESLAEVVSGIWIGIRFDQIPSAHDEKKRYEEFIKLSQLDKDHIKQKYPTMYSVYSEKWQAFDQIVKFTYQLLGEENINLINP